MSPHLQRPRVQECLDRGSPYWFFRYWEEHKLPDSSVKAARKRHIIGLSQRRYALSQRQAEKARDRFLAGLQPQSASLKTSPGPVAQPTRVAEIHFGQLAAVWRSDFVERQASGRPLLSASTRAKYLRHLQNHVLPHWRDTPVEEMRPKVVLDWLQQEGQSWYMMADLRNLMSGIFTRALEWELLPDSFANPLLRVRLPRKWEVREKKILSPEQTVRVLARLHDPVRLISQTCLETAMSPSVCPPATGPSRGWSLPAGVKQSQSWVIGDALMSAYLRQLLDSWINTGRSANGIESVQNRDLHRARRCWDVVSQCLESNPPIMEPATRGNGFKLTIAVEEWRGPQPANFFDSQMVRAHQTLVTVLTSSWVDGLCKCRYPPCGRYFVASRLRRIYQHGTFCCAKHRVYASAEVQLRTQRNSGRSQLIAYAALWLRERKSTSGWQHDRRQKDRLVAAINRYILNPKAKKSVQGIIKINWVTRNRVAIERQREDPKAPTPRS